ncbi:MAG: protein kinase [Akkermansia sp.]|nr:protein kinase [Akkermansia sp.]
MQLVTALPPGTVLGEPAKYKILGVCGQGGFGITYTGWDISLERNVAIKECFPQEICVRDGDTEQITPRMPALRDAYLLAMADLQKEARLLAKLNHPNIVQVYDVFAANGSLFCVMHWLEGDMLRDRLDAAEAADAPIPAEQAEEWLRKLLDALGYMHAQGVIHRDIKPENIMFDESGRPVLVDFGSAVNISRLTHTLTQGAFSAAYAAPEQLSGKGEIGPWTDFYSLAATWYEVFSNCAAEETLRRMMEDSLEPLEKLVPERVHAAPRMAAGIMRNLGLQAAGRCQSAAEWLSMLDGKPQPRKPRRPWKRSGLLWAGALAAAVLGWCVAERVLTDSTEDTTEPPAEREPNMDSLYRQAKEHYNIDTLFSKRAEIKREAEALLEEYRAESDKLVHDAEQEMARSDLTLDELRGLLDAAQDRLTSLHKREEAKLSELEKRNDAEIARPFMHALDELEMNKGWEGLSLAEKVALPQVAKRINKEQFKYSGPLGVTMVMDIAWGNLPSKTSSRLIEAYDRRFKEIHAQQMREFRRQEEEEEQREIQRQQEEQQREIDKKRMTDELYAKVHAQSGMVELMQKAEQMQKEYAAIPAEGTQAIERIAKEGIAKAKAAHVKEVSKIQLDAEAELWECEREYRKKASVFRDRYDKEVRQPLINIVDNCSRSSDFTFITKEDRDLLGDIRDRISEEILPYKKLPSAESVDAGTAYNMLYRGIMDVGKQKKLERDAAVERLYRKVVDEKKLEALVERRKELNRQRRELYKKHDEKLERHAAQVVPKIKAKPRKEWADAINAAEQEVDSITNAYMLMEKLLIAESQKVASVASSYLDRMEKGKGEEFANLTDEEKDLLPDVSRMARIKIDGGQLSWNVTRPMMETNELYRVRYIESRVYKDVDMDALQEEDEKEAMRELGL